MSLSECHNRLIETEKEIKESIQDLVLKYSLAQYRQKRAIFFCPFGEHYQRATASRLKETSALQILTKQNFLKVFILTDASEGLNDLYPDYCEVIIFNRMDSLPSTEVMLSRFFKWSIPILFRNIERSVYIDSEMMVTSSESKLKLLFDLLENYDLVVTDHNSRSGWKDEYLQIIRCKRERSLEKLNQHRDFLEAANLSLDIPICQTGFMVRKHSPGYDNLYLNILSQLFLLSERDQLAVPYAMQTTGLAPHRVTEGQFVFTGIRGSLCRETVCFVHTSHLTAFKYANLQLFFQEKLRQFPLLDTVMKYLFKFRVSSALIRRGLKFVKVSF